MKYWAEPAKGFKTRVSGTGSFLARENNRVTAGVADASDFRITKGNLLTVIKCYSTSKSAII